MNGSMPHSCTSDQIANCSDRGRIRSKPRYRKANARDKAEANFYAAQGGLNIYCKKRGSSCILTVKLGGG